MSRKLEYGGYLIESAPTQIADANAWKVKIYISWGEGDNRVTRTFSSNEVSANETAADDQGILFAKQVIDGSENLLSHG
ncbi:hypothetical protein W02_10910 [Nitrospira sp. KM1]|uniref:CV_2116 domain-containing protein n=1 Tax=Nitrospira sp. KM1 TaxID=1936990 RepID=UPI0013A7633A|nr:hypothetical protein [Nitrospira sp. KM1]BCA53951.1 hypothetical protein W02_10910 [Nitrospira sp. KM1]